MVAMRKITIRYTSSRECPNCDGRGDDGYEWRPVDCRRCQGRGRLVTGVEVEDSESGVLGPESYDFNAQGEVYLVDFDFEEEVEVIRPEQPGLE